MDGAKHNAVLLQRHDSLSLAHRRLSKGPDPSQGNKLDLQDAQRASRPSLINQGLMRSQGMMFSWLCPMPQVCRLCCWANSRDFVGQFFGNEPTCAPCCAGSLKAILRTMISPFAVAPKPSPPAREAAAHPLQSALRSSSSQRRSTGAQSIELGEDDWPEDENDAGQAPTRSNSLRRASTVRFSDEQEASTHERRSFKH